MSAWEPCNTLKSRDPSCETCAMKPILQIMQPFASRSHIGVCADEGPCPGVVRNGDCHLRLAPRVGDLQYPSHSIHFSQCSRRPFSCIQAVFCVGALFECRGLSMFRPSRTQEHVRHKFVSRQLSDSFCVYACACACVCTYVSTVGMLAVHCMGSNIADTWRSELLRFLWCWVHARECIQPRRSHHLIVLKNGLRL